MLKRHGQLRYLLQRTCTLGFLMRLSGKFVISFVLHAGVSTIGSIRTNVSRLIMNRCTFLPQDTTRLLNILPLSPASLPDIVRVVWTGKSTPEKSQLAAYFTVRRQKVYDALHWLCHNHDDYRHVTIDEERWASSESMIVATELLDSMGRVVDITITAEDASRSV